MSANCQDNAFCAQLGLEGACCDTVDGWTLDCCTEEPIPTACAANPACNDLGLTGDCCKTVDGVFLDCCTEVPNDCIDATHPACTVIPSGATCELNAACAALELDGVCCPTADGIFLDCCTDTAIPKECAANTACAALELADDCCPTADGVFLDCCNEFPNVCKDPNDPNCQIEPAASCKFYPACDALGLDGLCCDTIDGWTLDCCTEQVPIEPECAKNEKCAAEGLTEFCCPTFDGTFLACCDEVPNECQGQTECKVDPPMSSCLANAACNDLGLTGFWCDTVDGWTLACCDGAAVEETCQENPGCAALDLEGACCPAIRELDDGSTEEVYLDCCTAVPNECQNASSSSSNDECQVMSALSYKQSVQIQDNGPTGSSSAIATAPGHAMALSLLVTVVLLKMTKH